MITRSVPGFNISQVVTNKVFGAFLSRYNTREPTAEELVSTLNGLLSTLLTDGSRQLYRRAWLVFREFYAQFYGSANPSLPLFPHCIPLFISYLSFRKLAFSTITSYLAAISYVHKLRCFPDPTKSFLIQKLLSALSRKRSVDVRLAVTRPVLHELIRSLRFTNSSAFQRSLYAAMFLVAFYGLFRIGELATKSTRVAASVIQFNNLTFYPLMRLKLASQTINITPAIGHLTLY